mmetsp:Transcript_13896/g.29660  ORF Transcript_13896/g.29660 Transcript_13896/m.29660 type:complete len:214 (-) Transcript_13896:3208-3849(-)
MARRTVVWEVVTGVVPAETTGSQEEAEAELLEEATEAAAEADVTDLQEVGAEDRGAAGATGSWEGGTGGWEALAGSEEAACTSRRPGIPGRPTPRSRGSRGRCRTWAPAGWGAPWPPPGTRTESATRRRRARGSPAGSRGAPTCRTGCTGRTPRSAGWRCGARRCAGRTRRCTAPGSGACTATRRPPRRAAWTCPPSAAPATPSRPPPPSILR